MKFLRAIISEVRERIPAHLQTIRADNAAGGHVLDNQVIAYGIEWVRIEAGRVRGREALVQLEVKNLVAQILSGADFLRVSRQASGVMRWRADQQPRRFESGAHTDMLAGTCYDHVPTGLIIFINKLRGQRERCGIRFSALMG